MRRGFTDCSQQAIRESAVGLAVVGQMRGISSPVQSLLALAGGRDGDEPAVGIRRSRCAGVRRKLAQVVEPRVEESIRQVPPCQEAPDRVLRKAAIHDHHSRHARFVDGLEPGPHVPAADQKRIALLLVRAGDAEVRRHERAGIRRQRKSLRRLVVGAGAVARQVDEGEVARLGIADQGVQGVQNAIARRGPVHQGDDVLRSEAQAADQRVAHGDDIVPRAVEVGPGALVIAYADQDRPLRGVRWRRERDQGVSWQRYER